MSFKLNLIFVRRRLCYLLLLLVVVLIMVLKLAPSPSSGENWVTYQAVTGRSRGSSSSDQRTILLWTEFFSQRDYIPPVDKIGCPQLNCKFTSNRTSLQDADAVVLHARDTNILDLPKFRSPRQRWVLLHHESPHNTPDFFRQLDGRINWTVTYRLDSDVLLSPLVVLKELSERGTSKLGPPRDVAASKTRMVVWFVSNCVTSSNREAYVKELQKTLHVDVIGSCGDRECVPKMSEKCYSDAARQYRFYLSFENSLCRDYVTEKFFHVLDYDMVPVVFGGADYTRMAPPGSYVNALDFDSPRALGKHLLDLAKDPDRYNAFFRWKDNYRIKGEHYACALCRKLHDPSEPAKVWNHLHRWWFDQAKCTRWNGRKSSHVGS